MELMSKKVILAYSQEEDCDGRSGHHDQFLTVETCDGGGGHYFVISTERWAFDTRDDAIKMLDRIFSDLKL